MLHGLDPAQSISSRSVRTPSVHSVFGPARPAAGPAESCAAAAPSPSVRPAVARRVASVSALSDIITPSVHTMVCRPSKSTVVRASAGAKEKQETGSSSQKRKHVAVGPDHKAVTEAPERSKAQRESSPGRLSQGTVSSQSLGSQDVRKRLYGKQAPDFAWASVLPKSPQEPKPASLAQVKRKRNPYFVEALKWTCPVCHEELTVRGHDNGLQQRKRHLQVMHNLMPHQVGGSRSHKAKLGAKKRAHNGIASVAIQRAIMKKKQVEHEHDHDLVHSTTQGLFPYFKKTWFCKKCVKRGCAREMAQKKCNMDYWGMHCAKWWNRIPSSIKDKIQYIANWAAD